MSLIDHVDAIEVHHSQSEIDALLGDARSQGKRGIKIPVDLALVSWWYRSVRAEPEHLSLRFRLMDPEKREVAKVETGADLTEKFGFRRILLIQSMPLTAFGTYFWRVESRQPNSGQHWKLATKQPLNVRIGRKQTG